MVRKRKPDAAVDEKERQRLALRAKLLAARDAALRAQYAPEPKDYAIFSWPEMVTWVRNAVEAKEPDFDTAVHYLKRLLAEFRVNRAGIHAQCERLLLLSEGMTEHDRFLAVVDQIEFNIHMAVGASIAGLDLGEDDVEPEHYLTLESTVLRRVLEHAGRSLFKNLPDFNCNAARRRLRRERALLKAPAEKPAKVNAKPIQESLTDDEYTLLRALRDARPRRLAMIELQDKTTIARKTCGAICTRLAKRGLADYDCKKRIGAAITAAGDGLLALEHPLTAR